MSEDTSASVRWQRRGVLACLGGSALALAVAPLFMPASYSWVSHTTSESAAQGLRNAWVARLGFLAFGFAVLWLSSLTRPSWGRLGSRLHRFFGVMMVSSAVFSHQPFGPAVEFDRIEDALHSVAATTMGFAFALGIVSVWLRRSQSGARPQTLDVVAVTASVVIPLGMGMVTDAAGILQRSMFVIAYVWYGAETGNLGRDHTRLRRRPGDGDAVNRLRR